MDCTFEAPGLKEQNHERDPEHVHPDSRYPKKPGQLLKDGSQQNEDRIVATDQAGNHLFEQLVLPRR